MSKPKPVLARATITLPGFPAGRIGEVDPSSPYVADCFERGYLVREPAEPELPDDAGGS